MFLPPESSLVSIYDRPFRSFTIHLPGNEVNFLTAWFDPNLRSRAHAVHPLHWQTFPAPPDQEAMTYCQLLARRSLHHSDRRLKHLTELLMLRTLDLLDDSLCVSRSRAFQTYRHALHYVTEHCDSPINRKDVASALRIHPNHISRLFRTFQGRSFAMVLQEIRLGHSRKLLADHRMSIKEVAVQSGFRSANYFTRAFRRKFGCSPGEYRYII